MTENNTPPILLEHKKEIFVGLLTIVLATLVFYDYTVLAMLLISITVVVIGITKLSRDVSERTEVKENEEDMRTIRKKRYEENL